VARDSGVRSRAIRKATRGKVGGGRAVTEIGGRGRETFTTRLELKLEFAVDDGQAGSAGGLD
jgi:hypothetical protein